MNNNPCITDGQGNPIVVNMAYKFVFAMPGPDITIVIVKEINNDGTVNCFDVFFKLNLQKLKPKELFRPIRYPWTRCEIETIKQFGGDL